MAWQKLSEKGGWKYIGFVVLAGIVYFTLAWQIITVAASNTDTPAWANPSATTIRRVSQTTTSQTSPNLFDNMDCTPVTYRLPGSDQMSTGCFTRTALGFMDSDSDVVIFNGTDEGLPLFGFSPHQVIVPWPESGNLISLDPVNTGGQYISLYKNPLSVIQDQRNLLLKITAKKLTSAPDLQILDKTGKRLVINAQSLAFSDGGSWLVAETVNGSFVRINFATLDIKPFAISYGTSGSPAVLKSRISITDDGRFVAIYNKEAVSFKVFDLSECAFTSVNLEPENCRAHEYLPLVSNNISGLQSIYHVRFINDGLLSFEAVASGQNTGIYELAPADSITSLTDYIGLGDSYTSGEGAFDYLDGTDTQDNRCHLSIKSYPILLTGDLFTSRGGHSVACSGAVISDVGSKADSYRGQVRGVLDFKHLKDSNSQLLDSVITNFAPGYIAQQRFVKNYQPAIITVSVGGNDIGFGDILRQCVMPHISLHRSANDCFNTYEDRLEIIQLIDRTVPRWTDLFQQLAKSSPRSQIYALGYPEIAVGSGNCASNVHLSTSEIEFATETINYLNEAIQKSASQAGVQYIDISTALAGHRMCETSSYNVAVNGLTTGKDSFIVGRESYHPNALGHQLIEQAILRQSRNLTTVEPFKTKVPREKLLSAQKSGRPVLIRRAGVIAATSIIKRGVANKIAVSGSTHGLKPKTVYSLRLGGYRGTEIGPITSSPEGDIETNITIPPTAPAGGNTLDIIGENQAGEVVDIVQPILIAASGVDIDGDGMADSFDSCPTTIDSNLDADKDGVDDSCDGNIGITSSGSGSIDPQTQTPPSADTTGQPNSTDLLPEITLITQPRQISLGAALSIGRTNNPTLTKQVKNMAIPLETIANTKINPVERLRPTNVANISAVTHADYNWRLWLAILTPLWLAAVCIILYIQATETVYV